MRYLQRLVSIGIVTICLCTIVYPFGYQPVRSFVEDDVLVVVVAQPDCPLKVEKAEVVKIDGKWTFSYSVSNKGPKSVKAYTIARWFSDNTGDVMTGKVPIAPTGGTNELTASDVPSGGKRKRTGIIKIAFVMLVEIEFTDGTEYSDQATLDALEAHLTQFETLYDKKAVQKRTAN